MTLKEAIERTNKVLEIFDYRLEEVEKDAMKLLIEAGKRHMRLEASHEPGLITPLPGETEE